MNTKNQNSNGHKRNGRHLSFQVAEAPVKAGKKTRTPDKIVSENEFGNMVEGYFKISIDSTTEKGAKAYENANEPFQFQQVGSMPQALRYFGAKVFPDANIELLGKALTIEDDKDADKSLGEANDAILKVLNQRIKADAKTSASQKLVNKYTPLEGEQRLTAVARTINNMIKLTSLPAEVIIEMLKEKKAVDADYTVRIYLDTPLRKTDGGVKVGSVAEVEDDEDEDDEEEEVTSK